MQRGRPRPHDDRARQPGTAHGNPVRNLALPKSPGGGSPGHLFPAVTIDAGGNVYAAWIDDADNNVYYSYSINQGKTWSLPAKVNAAPAVTNEFLWAQAGSKGTLALAWYGTDQSGQPDDFAVLVRQSAGIDGGEVVGLRVGAHRGEHDNA